MRTRIPDPDFFASRVPDFGIRDWKLKLKINLFFNRYMGWGSGIRDLGSVIRDLGSGIRDLGSGIRDPRSGIRDLRSGSWIRIQGSKLKKHQIPDPNPQHWWKAVTFSWELPPFMVRIFVSFSWECRIEIPWRQKNFYLKRAAKFH